MPYKDILVYADTIAAAQRRMELAASTARAHGARLVALHVSTPPFIPIDFSGAMSPSVIEWQEQYQHQQADATRKLVDGVRERTGQDVEYRLVHGDLVDAALRHSRAADLVVLSQSGVGDDDPVSADVLPEALVMGAGRPILVVPRRGNFDKVGARALIAWNGTRESTRAVHDALPLIAQAKAVTVIEILADTVHEPRDGAADMARHLTHHGIHAEAVTTNADNMDVGEFILSRAADLGADLIVMGAYGHSRLREFALGGVTRHLLEHMTVPVLMSH